MALNLVTDNVGVVVFGVDRAIIMGDSVKCAGAPVIIPRQSVYEPMTTGLKADTARASAWWTSSDAMIRSPCERLDVRGVEAPVRDLAMVLGWVDAREEGGVISPPSFTACTVMVS